MQQIERGGEIAAELPLVPEVEADSPGIVEAGVEVAQRGDQAARRAVVVDRGAQRHETRLSRQHDRVPVTRIDACVAVGAGEQQRWRAGVEDPAGGPDDAPWVGRPDQPGAGREVVEVVGDAASLGKHVLDRARVHGAVPACADLQRETPVRAPGVLDVGPENLLGDLEVGVLQVPEEDDGARGRAGGEILERVEVVAPVGVPREKLAQGVMAQREARTKLVVPRDEGEPLLDLELPLVVGDRQPPGFAEGAERRVVDPEGAFPISRSRAHTHRRHGHPLQTVPSAGLIERPQEKNRVDALR